jgi:hypothetical protein
MILHRKLKRDDALREYLNPTDHATDGTALHRIAPVLSVTFARALQQPPNTLG